MSSELIGLTATQAVRLIHDGKLRPEALMEAYLDHIAQRDPAVRAFAHFDPAEARAGGGQGSTRPLQGIPIGVKDVLDTADMPSQYGSPIWANWQPKADSAPVAWARDAGGIVIGKTVTTEFATRKPGPTMNPANPAHTPGGSSSGSAAGVGAGLFPLAYGTQTAGSVIRPAAYCGVVGYKPTYGMISRIGMKIMSDSLDTIGTMARTVADCALFAAAVSGRDLGDPDAKPGRAPRIGICRSPTWDAAAPETQALLARVTEALARAGASVNPRELPLNFNALIDAHPIIMNSESARALGWELTHHPRPDQRRPARAAGLGPEPTPVRPRRRLRGLRSQPNARSPTPWMASTCWSRRPPQARHPKAWNGPATPPSISSGHRSASPASPSRRAPARTACRSVSRSSAAKATTERSWPGPAGCKPRLSDAWRILVRRRPAPELRPHPPRLRRPPARRADPARRLQPARSAAPGFCRADRAGLGCPLDLDTGTRPPTKTDQRARDLGLRVYTTIEGLRIAGLPGVFKNEANSHAIFGGADGDKAATKASPGSSEDPRHARCPQPAMAFAVTVS